MKKAIAITVVLAVAGMAQASMINWGGNFVTGTGVYEYVGSNGYTGGQFTSDFTAYLINTATFNPIDPANPDLMQIQNAISSAIVSAPLYVKDSGVGKKVSLTTVPNIIVPDFSDVYTILENADASNWMILDNPVNVGSFDPDGNYTPTQAIPATDSTIHMGTQNWVVPEPTSIAMMGLVSGFGLFVRRRFQIV